MGPELEICFSASGLVLVHTYEEGKHMEGTPSATTAEGSPSF